MQAGQGSHVIIYMAQKALVLWFFVFVVTESSTGPGKRFKEMSDSCR
jgi:hypothetical protein